MDANGASSSTRAPAIHSPSSTLVSPVTASEDRIEADRAVFAKSASIRRLSVAPTPTTADENGSSHTSGNQESALSLSTTGSIRQKTPAPSPNDLAGLGSAEIHTTLRRPAHSRIHQALRQSESEFVFSSKQSTVDGLLYSSRFDHLEHLNKDRPKSSSSSLQRRLLGTKAHAKVFLQQPYGSAASAPKESASSLSESYHVEVSNQGASSSSDQLTLPRRRHAISGSVPQADTGAQGTNATAGAKATPARQHQQSDESSFLQRKRRCAKTFEDMILARVRDARDQNALEQNMASILSHRIIQSVLGLSAIADSAT